MLTKFDRKGTLKLIHTLVSLHYGSFTDLVNLTMQEISDIYKVIQSIEQQKTLEKAGLK